MRTRVAFCALLAAVLGGGVVQAQTVECRFRGAFDALRERPSPLDSVLVELGGETAKLCYGRPSARGRELIGDTEPFGSPWRFGANEPTTLHLPFRAEIGGIVVAPGSYSLYAIPEEDHWTIVINGNTNRWGIPLSSAVRRSDIGSFRVEPERTNAFVETLTFSFESEGSSGSLVYAWENTVIRIPVALR
jgi:Protein of unknown function (DUF2911)